MDVNERRPKTRGLPAGARCGEVGGKRRWEGKTMETHSVLIKRTRRRCEYFCIFNRFLLYYSIRIFTSCPKTTGQDKFFEKLSIYIFIYISILYKIIIIIIIKLQPRGEKKLINYDVMKKTLHTVGFRRINIWLRCGNKLFSCNSILKYKIIVFIIDVFFPPTAAASV